MGYALLVPCFYTFAQIGVYTGGSQADNSAILDVSATDKGVLIPRLTTVQRDAILPVTGLIIYNTSANDIEYYNGSVRLQGSVLPLIPVPNL